MSKENLRLAAILTLITTSNADEFKNAYNILTGEKGGASIVYYLQKLGEKFN